MEGMTPPASFHARSDWFITLLILDFSRFLVKQIPHIIRAGGNTHLTIEKGS
jgi:hypothetical protein